MSAAARAPEREGLSAVVSCAKLLGDVGEEEEALLLEGLCAAAWDELAGRLRPGLAPEDCAAAFVPAAAWTALAALCAGQEVRAEPAAWSAGAVSVSGQPSCGQRAQALREQAQRLMVPYVRDDRFCFKGVGG